MPRQTVFLYDIKDSCGSTIYVGITANLSERRVAHEASRKFGRQVHLSVVRKYNCKCAARKAERRRISRLRPRFNLQCRAIGDRPPTGNRKKWDRELAELMLRAGCATADVAAIVGVDRVTVSTNFNSLVARNLSDPSLPRDGEEYDQFLDFCRRIVIR